MRWEWFGNHPDMFGIVISMCYSPDICFQCFCFQTNLKSTNRDQRAVGLCGMSTNHSLKSRHGRTDGRTGGLDLIDDRYVYVWGRPTWNLTRSSEVHADAVQNPFDVRLRIGPYRERVRGYPFLISWWPKLYSLWESVEGSPRVAKRKYETPHFHPRGKPRRALTCRVLLVLFDT